MYDDSFKLRYSYAPIAISVSTSLENTPEHIHNEIEILFIENGCSDIKIGNSIYTAKAGDLLFVNPLEAHSVTVNSNLYFHKCICFDTDLIADKSIKNALQSGEILIPHCFNNKDINISTLKENFINLFCAVENNKTTLMLESTMHISALFLHLADSSLLIQKYETKKEREFCQRTLKYISENYGRKITSKDVATELFYTQHYFCRAFKKNFGVAFSDYLNMYRVFKAKEILLHSTLSIADVSAECGFESPAYFARVFKKHIGMSATKFQKVNAVQINS